MQLTKPSRSGWMQKASEDKKKWQKRWIELQEHQLTYTSKQGKPAEGLLDLHGVLDCKAVAVDGKAKNIVCLTTKLRAWNFAADTEADMKAWVAAIKDVLSGLDKEFALTRIPMSKVEEKGGDVVNALEELPEEAKVIVRAMGLTKEVLMTPRDFPSLLNILSFQIGRRLVTTKYPNLFETPENTAVGGEVYTTDALNAGRRWVQETVMRTFEKHFKVRRAELRVVCVFLKMFFSFQVLPTKLGEGGYGVVYMAQQGKDKKNNVAVKKSENRDEKARATNLRELYYLMTLEEPHIVKCFDCYDMKQEGQMWAILEYMDGGTLTQARKNHVWIPAEVAYISRELLAGVAFLHSRQVIHRDIKSSNVMFSVNGEVKLIDFGLATNFPNPDQRLRGIIGSAFWVAPEMIRGLRHDHKCDIWSAGMCLFELVNGHIPHLEDAKDTQGISGAKGSRAMFLVASGVPVPFDNPDAWSEPSCKEFFSLLQQFEPAARPEAQQLLQHAFLKQSCSQDAIKKMLVTVFRQGAMAMF